MTEKNVAAATAKAIAATVRKISRKKTKLDLMDIRKDLKNANE